MLRDGPAGEYYLLGDNSLPSKDSRLWWELGAHLAARGEACQPGTILADQVIGTARLVYWPPDRWHRLD